MVELTIFILHVLLLRGVGISKHLVKIIKLFIQWLQFELLTKILKSYCAKMDLAIEIPSP